MSLLDQDLTHLDELVIRAQKAEVKTYGGREALRLQNGLVLVPGFRTSDATVEVMIAADGAAFPGIAFRVADTLNYELAYATPQNSGRWDALQYDPVFRGSNTWQLFSGPSYQKAADVPTGEWYRLRVSFFRDRAVVSVNDQAPLVVEELARRAEEGLVGIWSFLPAYFCDLRVLTSDAIDGLEGVRPQAEPGVVYEWFVENYGVVGAGLNGVVNLNRLISPAVGEARLVRRFEIADDECVRFEFGFSDSLSLELDGEAIFSGDNTYRGGDEWDAQGYVEVGARAIERYVKAGSHRLTACLKVSEGFGWGFGLAAHAEGLQWLEASFG
jgi:hypothetical protein